MTVYSINGGRTESVQTGADDFITAVNMLITIAKDSKICSSGGDTANLIAAAQEIENLKTSHLMKNVKGNVFITQAVTLCENVLKSIFFQVKIPFSNPLSNPEFKGLQDGNEHYISLYDYITASDNANFYVNGDKTDWINFDHWLSSGITLAISTPINPCPWLKTCLVNSNTNYRAGGTKAQWASYLTTTPPNFDAVEQLMKFIKII